MIGEKKLREYSVEGSSSNSSTDKGSSENEKGGLNLKFGTAKKFSTKLTVSDVDQNEQVEKSKTSKEDYLSLLT